MTDPDDLRRALDEVVERGAPAQRVAAGELIARWDAGAPDLETASALVDAFRHDPYLWR